MGFFKSETDNKIKNKNHLFRFKTTEKSDVLSSANVKNLIGMSSDVDIRKLKVGKDRQITLYFSYIDGMVATEVLDDNILKPLVSSSKIAEISDSKELFDGILTGLIPHNQVKSTDNLAKCVDSILFGFAVLIFDDLKKAIIMDVKGFDKRSVPETSNENVIKGGRDSFIETIRTNTALIRTHMQSENLRIIEESKGDENHTQIALVYLEGVADERTVNRIKEKIDDIKVDNIITSSLVEDHIIKQKFAIFPRVLYTERPDKFCAHISNGKVGIIINGLPTAYILPVTFGNFLQAAEDYSYNAVIAMIIKFVRYLALFIAILAPAYYIAATNFHQEMLPREFAISIIKSKEGVPFSSILETLFILFIFELLIEAGMRMPKAISTVLSIIGALVLGDAAISGKFVSAAVIVVIALAGIAGFAIPNQDFANAVRICRLIFALSASVGGFFGLFFSVIFLLFSLAKSQTVGMPYLYPFVSLNDDDSSLFNFKYPLKKRLQKERIKK